MLFFTLILGQHNVCKLCAPFETYLTCILKAILRFLLSVFMTYFACHTPSDAHG